MSRHQDHVEAIGFAGMQVQELQDLIQATLIKQGEIVQVVLNAVGEDPVNQHARQAWDWVAGLGQGLEEMVGVCENVKAELNQYSGLL